MSGIELILAAINLLIKYEPEIAATATTAINLFTSGTPPTAEQEAQFKAALDAAHAKLQAS